MATGGAYRIESTTINKEFYPAETSWTEQQVALGLNGIPVNSGYKLLNWDLEDVLGSDYDDLAALFDSQQSSNSQLVALETDPYEANRSCNSYGTVTYNDFTILSISPRTRGLPNYQNVQVQFEVFVS